MKTLYILLTLMQILSKLLANVYSIAGCMEKDLKGNIKTSLASLQVTLQNLCKWYSIILLMLYLTLIIGCFSEIWLIIIAGDY